MICVLEYFNDIGQRLSAQGKVRKFMNYFCLLTFSFNCFEVRLAPSFWFFLVGYLLPLIFKLFLKWNIGNIGSHSEAYSEPCQTFEMEVFTKLLNDVSFLTIFTKSSILDVWQGFEFASEPSNDLRKKLHLRCLAGSNSPLYKSFSQGCCSFVY